MTTFDYNNKLLQTYLENDDTEWGDDMLDVEDEPKDCYDWESIIKNDDLSNIQYNRGSSITTTAVTLTTDRNDSGDNVHTITFIRNKYPNSLMGTSDEHLFVCSGTADKRIWFDNVEKMRNYYKIVRNCDLNLEPSYLSTLQKNINNCRKNLPRDSKKLNSYYAY